MAQSAFSLAFAAASSHWVSIPATAPTGAVFTIAAWVKQTVNTGYKSVYVNSLQGLWLSDGKLDYYQSGDHLGTAAISLNVWHHIAITNDGNIDTQKFYIDGVLDATGSASGLQLPHSTGGNLGIGGHASEYFDGNIDDVGVWTSVLTPTQIAQLAAGTLDQATISSAGLWRLEEGTGNQANDSSGNGNTGTLTNGPTWSSDVPSQLAGGGGVVLPAAPLAMRKFRTVSTRPRAFAPGVSR